MKIKNIAKTIMLITVSLLASSCSIMSTEGELKAPEKYTKNKIIDTCKTILTKNGWEICSVDINKGELSASKPDTTVDRPSSSKIIRTINVELDDTVEIGTIVYLSAASSRGQWSSNAILNWFSYELRKYLPGTKVIHRNK
ncbi:MAG: hypothetical protein GY756_25905 [bacterium]|nr:hypothetical protein [bacterium]